MPFPFTLSTTSHLAFQNNFTSSTHPSLPTAATQQRNLLRSTLKTFKRLPSQDQSTQLGDVVSALEGYLKYLSSLDISLSGRPLAGEDVDLALVQEVEVEWRPTLAAPSVPGREVERVRGRGLDYDFFFLHHTYALTYNLLARQALIGLYAPTVPTSEQRLGLIQTATKHIKTAYTIHSFLLAHATFSDDGPPVFPPAAVDISTNTQTALQRLCQAECNLLTALKDDPYPAILVQARNELDRDWMIKAPDIPKTRVQVLTRLCIGASEQCAAARSLLSTPDRRVSRDLAEYIDDLRLTARARACRLQALDADTHGQTGTAIAWLHAGLHTLGVEVSAKLGSSKPSGLSRLKASIHEKREDKKIARGSVRWGADAGRAEEVRILEYLERKFVRANDALHFQKVPEFRGLVGTLPGGMNVPLGQERWVPLVLAEEELLIMRAPPDDEVMAQDSSGDEAPLKTGVSSPAGAFPGSENEYKVSYY